MKVLIVVCFVLLSSLGCTSMRYQQTVNELDIQRFMGDWYVVAGRTSFLEKGAYNSIERYSWNESKKRIDIHFSFNKGSFTGKQKVITQKAWIENKKTNAYWKVQPLWPLKLDYLVIALDEEEYQWTIIGVPSQAYVWIMTRDQHPTKKLVNELIAKLKQLNYSDKNIELIQHQ